MWIESIIIIAVILMFLQAFVYDKLGLWKVNYKRIFEVPSVFEGQKVKMIEVISNNKLLPIPWLKVESKLNKNLIFKNQNHLNIYYDEFHQSIFMLKPYMKITRKHEITCLKRGIYKLNSVTLTCGNLFLINANRFREKHVDATLLVYPRLIDIKQIPVPCKNWQGDVTVKRWIYQDPFLVSGIREYRYGDSIKDINWKAFARTNKLQVNQRDFTADPKIMIYLNVDIEESQYGIPDSRKDYIETGIRYVASLANEWISKGIPVGFATNGYRKDHKHETIKVPPRCSKEQITYILSVLAQLVILRRVSFHTFLDEQLRDCDEKRDVLIMSTYISKKINERIQRLKLKGNSVSFMSLTQEEGSVQQVE